MVSSIGPTLTPSPRRPERTRRASKTLRWAATLAALLALGSRSACFTYPPTLVCNPLNITLVPGECQAFDNPCASSWERLDTFRFCSNPGDVPGQVYLNTSSDPRAREICALDSAPPISNRSINFLYTTRYDLGEGTLTVSVIDPFTDLSATATATPPVIQVGGASQLDVVVSDGTPPYSYSWSPPFFLSAADVSAPIAEPPISLQYDVTVTDADGGTAQASALVAVGVGVEVTAEPESLALGGSSQLTATAIGGTAPFSYAWIPADSLDDAEISEPLATPTRSEIYQVTVTDAVGQVAVAQAQVQVDMELTATAQPPTIASGESSQLAVDVSGGRPPYTYAWTPAASLDDPALAGPLASPAATTAYTVTVNDAFGAQQTAMVDVEVGDPGLTAQFTYAFTTPMTVEMDGSASTGPIALYYWWCDYSFPGDLYDWVTTTPFSVDGGPCFYETPGEVVTLRLEVHDAQMPPNTAFSEQIVTVPP